VPLTIGSPDGRPRRWIAAWWYGALTASSGGGLTLARLLKYRYAFPTSFVNSTPTS